MNPLQFLRMAHWARRPPSKRMVMVVLGVIAVCAVLWGIERLWGWPDWLVPERTGRRVMRP
ncbi:hypothetical protein [Pseudoroseicyclus tamaricis]|uniref:Uncharacterized protein n=1 Tax=Pseudoroseicyclus tamaricis TaxID=2705421 RepID=A0A6B2JRW8_9RHOB|nr:hypothetical protein [Pseudoroseicyclus tamaricis]NDV01317.1 hypothetical protein [Pseudoroseicyclus tamaricis]